MIFPVSVWGVFFSTAHVVIGGDVSLVDVRHRHLDGTVDCLLALAKISVHPHRTFFIAGIGDHRRRGKAAICVRGHERPNEESAIPDVHCHLDLHTYFRTLAPLSCDLPSQ
jgi:hypothetical protein